MNFLEALISAFFDSWARGGSGEAARLPSSNAIARTQLNVTAKCGTTGRTFIIGFRQGNGVWVAERAQLVQAAGSGGSEPRDGDNAMHASGSFTIGFSYPGCPDCGNKDFIKCGCGILSCMGLVRRNSGGNQYRCGGCQTWGTPKGTISDLTGQRQDDSRRLPGGPSNNRLGGGPPLLLPGR